MMLKDRWLHIVVALLVLAVGAWAGWWIMANTEWKDVQVPTPAKGEALENPYYATEQLLRKLGGTVVKSPNLTAMPPPHGRLILLTQDWDTFAGRQQQLKTWVEQGGHLVIPGGFLDQDALKNWLPVAVEKRKNDDDDQDDDDDAKPSSPASPASAAKAAPARAEKPIKIEGQDCYQAAEPPAVPARYAGRRDFVICDFFPTTMKYVPVQGRGRTLWQVDNRRGGTEVIRMPLGQGTVTVLDSLGPLLNRPLLRGDDALLVAAELQAQRGAVFWFVTEESREGLLAWLWRRGGVAIVLALLALALAVWRSAARFGPVARSASVHHR
jgi:hypothetical protein